MYSERIGEWREEFASVAMTAKKLKLKLIDVPLSMWIVMLKGL
jgi:hypothetical protein